MECALRPSTAESLAAALRSQLSPELVAALSHPDRIAALLASAGDGACCEHRPADSLRAACALQPARAIGSAAADPVRRLFGPSRCRREARSTVDGHVALDDDGRVHVASALARVVVQFAAHGPLDAAALTARLQVGR